MKPTISIGIQDFEKIRANRSFYIDKSMLIREWWECRDDVTLITRPRRFGKTLNLSMLNCFFPWRMRTGVTCSKAYGSGNWKATAISRGACL